MLLLELRWDQRNAIYSSTVFIHTCPSQRPHMACTLFPYTPSSIGGKKTKCMLQYKHSASYNFKVFLLHLNIYTLIDHISEANTQWVMVLNTVLGSLHHLCPLGFM